MDAANFLNTSLNVSNETNSGSSRHSTYISLAFITIPGVVTNIIALIFIIRDVKKAVFPVIILLLALCCADLLAVIFSAIRHLMQYFVSEMTYSLCASMSLMHIFFRMYSGVLNVMMATDRVLAISTPFYYKRNIDVTRWKVGCVVAAIGTALFACLPLFGLGDVAVTSVINGRTVLVCSTFQYRDDVLAQMYGILYSLVGFAIILTIVIENVILIRSILKLNSRIVNVSPLETSSSSTSDNASTASVTSFEIAFAKLMGCLAIVYLITGTPYNTLILLQQLNYSVSRTTQGLIHLMGGLSYTIDPIVYILIRKINRKRIVYMFNFVFRCRKNEINTKQPTR